MTTLMTSPPPMSREQRSGRYSPDDLLVMPDGEQFELVNGERVEVRNRRGAIELDVRSDDSLEPGCVFIPFHFREAAANVPTTEVLDPFCKIQEFKFCAVQVQSRRVTP